MGAAAGLERHDVPSPGAAWVLPGKVRRCGVTRAGCARRRCGPAMSVAAPCLFPVVFGLC